MEQNNINSGWTSEVDKTGSTLCYEKTQEKRIKSCYIEDKPDEAHCT
jgi:hypothetical protein